MTEWSRQDIVKKIPCHYKRPHNLRSFSYLLFDLGMIALLIFTYQRLSLPHLQWLVTLLFIYFMGVFFTALWVLGHECGHGAFCRPLWLQSTIGYLIHCALLTPYFAWRESHRLHHKYNNHNQLDTAYNGNTLNIKIAYTKPLLAIFLLPLQFWFYFLINQSMGRYYLQQKPLCSNHLSTRSFMMKNKIHLVLVDRVGLIAALLLVLIFVFLYGFMNIFCYFLGPLLVMNAYLVGITALHHGSSQQFPRYAANNWTFEKGVELTFNRQFGCFNWLGWVLHHITDSHIEHHVLSSMPHYYAKRISGLVQDHISENYCQKRRRLFLFWVYYNMLRG